jgi:hypothetical protein
LKVSLAEVLRAYDTGAKTFGIQQVAFVVDAPPDVDANRRYGLRADLQVGPRRLVRDGNCCGGGRHWLGLSRRCQTRLSKSFRSRSHQARSLATVSSHVAVGDVRRSSS